MYQAEECTELGTLSGNRIWANDINNRGQIAGTSETSANTEHATLWHDGAIRNLGTLGGDYSHAYAINCRGQVVGASTLASNES